MAVRIGVVGTGAIGQDHIVRLTNKISGSTVVAVNDISENNAKQAAEKAGEAKIYADPHALIKADDVDAVVVTSWGPSHEEFVVAAIQVGKYVFCEKPLAITAQGCKNIVEAELKQGKRLLQVGFMRPFDRTYRTLKEALDNNVVGRPLMVNCKHFNPTVNESYTTEMGVVDSHVHEIDVLRWLLNDDYKSARVQFPRSTSKAHEGVKDPQIVTLETKSGIIITTQIFVNCQYGYDIQCEVIGEDGIVSLPEPNLAFVRKNGQLQREIFMDWKKRFIEAYDVELQAFVDGVLKGELIEGATAWDGYVASVTADACAKSQKTGNAELIELPETPLFYMKK